MASSRPLLEARNISKRFPGTLALDGVSLSVQPAEVLAVVGENGAGKSTLMKIMAGLLAPDGGELLLDGRPLYLKGVVDGMRRGIVLVHQELNLADNLDVAANIFLGHEHLRGGLLGLLNRAAMAREASKLLDRVGLRISTSVRVGSLPLGQRQLIEIARALAQSVRLIIMDEPTSSLSQSETDRLFEVIADLKRSGVSVVYISHRLSEVQRIADRVVVLRDGRNSGELSRERISHAALVTLMVGRDLKQFFHREHASPVTDTPARLEVRNLVYEDGPAPISFAVRGGEIVGMAGLVGAGRTELSEALFGIRCVTGGRVLLDGQPVEIRSPAAAIAAGILLAPEDRRRHGLVVPESVLRNMSLPSLWRNSFMRIVLRDREREMVNGLCQKLRVKTPRLSQPVGILSGGNQQKVVLGKWLALKPRVLILDEPTRGVDVGAKSEIYALIDQLAVEGVAILLISSDLEEILGISDRVLVLHQGRLAGELKRGELSEQAVMHLATGGQENEE